MIKNIPLYPHSYLDIFANRVRKAQQLFSDMSETVTENEDLTDEAEGQDMNMQF